MRDALEEFYRENRKMYLKRLYHRAGSAYNAEDILQEAFYRALRYSNSFNPETQELGAWFSTILNNSLKTFKRDEKAMGTYVEYVDELTEGKEMSQTSGDMFDRINAEVEAYSGDNRDALYLYFVRGYRPREVRDVLDMPYKKIEKLCAKFKHDMRDKYEE